VQRGGKIAITSVDDPDCDACRSVGILPYFDRNIFINMPDSFWLWSTQNPTVKSFHQVLPSHPDAVVVELRTPYPENNLDLKDPTYRLLTDSGYTFTHIFCGARPEGLRLDEKSCHLIFEYASRGPNTNPSSAGDPSAQR
jgi:hypothetical protein